MPIIRNPSDDASRAQPGAAPLIRLLPDAVKSRIAAGEVIERPASVVKELVENALDAGASSIDIEIAAGGRDLIRVTDDGSGMSSEDLALSIRRHATSKLTCAEDLFSLSSMGFRGEALPSIGSVSKMTISTRLRGSAEAWRLSVEGGRSTAPAPASGSFGTTVEVRDLLYNLPARKKFLNNPGPEAAACADAVLRLSLIRPDVAFSLFQGKQEILHCPACAKPETHSSKQGTDGQDRLIRGVTPKAYAQRVRDALGKEASSDLVPLFASKTISNPPPDPEAGSSTPNCTYRLFGLITPPAFTRPNRSNIYLIVNGRAVRDRVFMSALTEAYRNLIPPKRFPAGVLFIEMPGTEVDINVHPAKAEVRFRNPGMVYSLLYHAVRESFLDEGASTSTSHGTDASTTVSTNAGTTQVSESPAVARLGLPYRDSTAPGASTPASSAPAPRLQRSFDLWQGERTQDASGVSTTTHAAVQPPALATRPASSPAVYPHASEKARVVAEGPLSPARSMAPEARLEAQEAQEAQKDQTTPLSSPALKEDASSAPELQTALQGEVSLRTNMRTDVPYRLLGQAGSAYLIIEDEMGVKIIDQHALHERTLFEELMEKARSGTHVPSQRLLLPETLELSPAQAAVFSDASAQEILGRLGYDTAEFGTRTIVVNAVPHMLRSVRAAEFIHEVLDAIAAVTEDHPDGKKGPDRSNLYEKAAFVLSCKGAVKAGERLNTQQMTALLNEYQRRVGARNFTCPHGRPLAIELSWDEIERRVGRG